MNNNDTRSKTVVMIRHAQSEWNRQNRFSGWADPALTDAGQQEAVMAGRRLADAGYRFDHAYTSMLQRARDTGQLVLKYSGNADVPADTDWRLNERHYGALQGVNKAQMASLVGEQQVWRWRRGYLERPPALAVNDPQHPAHQAQWSEVPAGRIPNGESLEQTRARVAEFWYESIQPRVMADERILVSSHGNTLRALLMELDGMSVSDVESFEIPTGVPIIYRFDGDGRSRGWRYLESARDAA